MSGYYKGLDDMELEFNTKAKMSFGRETIEHDVTGILL